MPHSLPFRFGGLASFLFVAAAAATLAGAQDADPRPVAIDVGGYRLNSLLFKPGGAADLPPILFLHGASASLYDPLYSFGARLKGRAALLFVDRPGHGASDIGPQGNVEPDGQADAIAALMARRGIESAIVVGHSFGGAIAAALAMRHPEKVRGLLFLSPALYAWPGGIAWYYEAARAPAAGAVFSSLFVPVFGALALDRAVKSVFAPNPRPENYIAETRAAQALRPRAFRHNAREVGALSAWAQRASPGYRHIRAPAVIVTGDADRIVSPEIHARRLAREVAGARLLVVRNLGHKSDFVAADLAIAAIESLAGRRVDLKAAVRAVEQRIAADGQD